MVDVEAVECELFGHVVGAENHYPFNMRVFFLEVQGGEVGARVALTN